MLPHAPSCLQTKKGETAKSMTLAEFADHLRNVGRELVARGERLQRQWFSWDNARANGGSEQLLAAGLPADHRLPLPPYSPDLHRVVEHAIGRVKAAMDATMLAMATGGWPADAARVFQTALREAARNTLDAGPIIHDAASLRLAYRVVAGEQGETVHDEDGHAWECTEGDWLPEALR